MLTWENLHLAADCVSLTKVTRQHLASAALSDTPASTQRWLFDLSGNVGPRKLIELSTRPKLPREAESSSLKVFDWDDSLKDRIQSMQPTKVTLADRGEVIATVTQKYTPGASSVQRDV